MTKKFVTKEDCRDFFVSLVDNVKPHMDKGFSKILWGTIPYISGGGRNSDVLDLYIHSVIDGTNPYSDKYWSKKDNSVYVLTDMATIACGLLINSDIITDMFTKNERKNITDWIYNINNYKWEFDNMPCYVILVNSSLRRLGRPYDSTKLDNGLKAVENMYIGKGFYGMYGVKDLNMTLMLQFYSLIYAKTMTEYDAARCRIYIKRATELLSELEGGIYSGYDKNYIMLMAFYSACLYAGIDIKNINILKSVMQHYNDMISRNIVCRKDNNGDIIYNNNEYNFFMWYMKTFFVLSLPDKHNFWAA